MSIVITTDIFCDGEDCSQWVNGVTGQRTNATAARRAAKRAGWKIGRRDLCPDCACGVKSAREDEAP